MESQKIVLALFMFGLQQCLAQTTMPPMVPPNCVCPSRPPPPPMPFTGTPIMPPGGPMGPMGPNGMRHGMMRMHQICGSDGQNYTNPCDFVNAKAMNQNLGMRPCFLNMMGQQNMMGQPMMSTMRPPRQMTVCMTNGQSSTSTFMQMKQQLMATSGLGIRCRGPCPCAAPVCPSFDHRRGPMMQADDSTMMA